LAALDTLEQIQRKYPDAFAAATTGPVKVSGPAEAAKLPKGTQFVTPDGRVMVVR
jgi:hypothetical protein